jgi:tetratricopeptide (TPR) repeat protein
VGDRSGEATTLNNIASVYYSLGQRNDAVTTFEQSLILRQAVGDRFGEIVAREWLSRLYDEDGQKEQALIMIAEAVRLAEAVEHPRLPALKQQLATLQGS